jgi:hypothetical protein
MAVQQCGRKRAEVIMYKHGVVDTGLRWELEHTLMVVRINDLQCNGHVDTDIGSVLLHDSLSR